MYVCMYVRRAHWFLNFIGIGGGGLVYLGAVYVYLYNRDRGSHDHFPAIVLFWRRVMGEWLLVLIMSYIIFI